MMYENDEQQKLSRLSQIQKYVFSIENFTHRIEGFHPTPFNERLSNISNSLKEIKAEMKEYLESQKSEPI